MCVAQLNLNWPKSGYGCSNTAMAALYPCELCISLIGSPRFMQFQNWIVVKIRYVVSVNFAKDLSLYVSITIEVIYRNLTRSTIFYPIVSCLIVLFTIHSMELILKLHWTCFLLSCTNYTQLLLHNIYIFDITYILISSSYTAYSILLQSPKCFSKVLLTIMMSSYFYRTT